MGFVCLWVLHSALMATAHKGWAQLFMCWFQGKNVSLNSVYYSDYSASKLSFCKSLFTNNTDWSEYPVFPKGEPEHGRRSISGSNDQGWCWVWTGHIHYWSGPWICCRHWWTKGSLSHLSFRALLYYTTTQYKPTLHSHYCRYIKIKRRAFQSALQTSVKEFSECDAVRWCL